MKRSSTAEASSPTASRDEIPIGDHLERMLRTAYRARRAVLLEGPTGVGKSELVRAMADRMGVGLACLDLSLLEPPDLVGLPTMASGRTVYANVVRRLYHFGRSVSDLAQACRLMREGAYDYLHAVDRCELPNNRRERASVYVPEEHVRDLFRRGRNGIER